VSTGWVGFKRPAIEAAVGVGSVGWFVNWVRELENRITVKATGAWSLYAEGSRPQAPSTNKALCYAREQGVPVVSEQRSIDKVIVHAVASL
jgi:hypothetical protein